MDFKSVDAFCHSSLCSLAFPFTSISVVQLCNSSQPFSPPFLAEKYSCNVPARLSRFPPVSSTSLQDAQSRLVSKERRRTQEERCQRAQEEPVGLLHLLRR
ncbi:hypothetical protein RvY_11034-1 [Ramazzottius varieornatus]|uniref:Uncharacterized protein n=1 Tax=Ramazzottius varieornatus TaxID=947166 RepID=A0A1D1VH81_RAMVA|nr:hypothetical protein RvY_11034-1 [Ramazzottius varieornatus]